MYRLRNGPRSRSSVVCACGPKDGKTRRTTDDVHARPRKGRPAVRPMEGEAITTPVTYYKNVMPLVQTQCKGCHTEVG